MLKSYIHKLFVLFGFKSFDFGTQLLIGGVRCDNVRSPNSGGNCDNLLRLRRKVRAGSKHISSECGGFDNLSINDLV